MTFGERLRRLMKDQGMSSVELSRLIGRNKTMISMWLNDKFIPKLDSIQEICKHLKLDAQDIEYLIMGRKNEI